MTKEIEGIEGCYPLPQWARDVLKAELNHIKEFLEMLDDL